MAINTFTDNRNPQSGANTLASDQLGLAPSEMQQTLHLAGLLQTSLEISQILEYFIESARNRVMFDSVHYAFDDLDTELSYGNRKRHSSAYRLRLAGEFLGELIFTRKQRFAEEELQKLENMLCQLIYPLRNAIWYQRALRAAHLDQLTGVNNRAAFESTLQREVELAHRNKAPLSLVVVDIDHFKTINDQYGHSSGDEILKAFAATLASNLRGSDIVFRFGGEEFVIILSNTDRDGANLVAERLRQAVLDTAYSCNTLHINVTASFGIAHLTGQDSGQSLFDKADQALYQAKQNGRNRVVAYGPQQVLQQAQV